MTEDELNEALLSLLKKGLIEVEYDEELKVTFKITNEGQQVVVDFIGDDFND